MHSFSSCSLIFVGERRLATHSPLRHASQGMVAVEELSMGCGHFSSVPQLLSSVKSCKETSHTFYRSGVNVLEFKHSNGKHTREHNSTTSTITLSILWVFRSLARTVVVLCFMRFAMAWYRRMWQDFVGFPQDCMRVE
jgi:hypothetical protein